MLQSSFLLLVMLVSAQPSFAADANSARNAAAKVSKVVKEESLNTITVAEKTVERLGVKVEPVATKSTRRTRLYSGEIITPVGRRGVVTAPFGGILKTPQGTTLKEGDTVKKGQIAASL